MLTLAPVDEVYPKWVSIPGSTGYSISDQAQVRNKHGRLLKQHLAARNAGLYVNLNGTTRLIHKLMLLAFVGPAEGRRTRWINGNKLDNRLSNLRYDEPAHSTTSVRPKRCAKNHELVGENVEFWGKNRICVACREGKPPNRELPEIL